MVWREAEQIDRRSSQARLCAAGCKSTQPRRDQFHRNALARVMHSSSQLARRPDFDVDDVLDRLRVQAIAPPRRAPPTPTPSARRRRTRTRPPRSADWRVASYKAKPAALTLSDGPGRYSLSLEAGSILKYCACRIGSSTSLGPRRVPDRGCCHDVRGDASAKALISQRWKGGRVV